MQKIYFLNLDTRKLHFVNGCKERPDHVEYFETEEAARISAGGELIHCKTCERKKEELIKQALKAKE